MAAPRGAESLSLPGLHCPRRGNELSGVARTKVRTPTHTDTPCATERHCFYTRVRKSNLTQQRERERRSCRVSATRSTARLSTGRAAAARPNPHSHPANPVSMVTAGREQRPGAEGTPLIGPPSLSASLWLPPPLSALAEPLSGTGAAVGLLPPVRLALLARVARASAGVTPRQGSLSSRPPVQMARHAASTRRHPRPRPMSVTEGQGYVKGVHRSEPRGEHRLT